jgi:hypothetical protein
VLVDTDKNGWDGWGLTETARREGTAVGVGCAGDKTYVGFALRGASSFKPNTKYRLSYFIRTEKLVSPTGRVGGFGACMEVEQYGDKAFGGTYSALRKPEQSYWNGDQEWVHQKLEFTTDDKVGKGKYKAMLWLRIFKASGTAWSTACDLKKSNEPKQP